MSGSIEVTPAAIIESVDHTGRGLRVEFFRLYDRYAHRILAVGCEELPILLLESIEATESERYPSSPALQALNIDDRSPVDNRQQRPAMLVGASVRGHWSLAIQPAAPESAALTFDAACRLSKLPDSLGSCYGWSERVAVEDADRIRRLHFGSGTCVVELWDGESYGLTWICDRYLRTLLFAAPGDPLETTLPTTVRWRYRLRIDDA